MNMIRDSLKDIHASEELKGKTLQYLEEQRKGRKTARAHIIRYAIAAVCMFLLLGTGGYSAYARPVSYISIDINPSIELGLNQFDRVVSVNAYNEDGKDILAQISLKNIPYLQAIYRLLEDKSFSSFLTENPLLVFTVISDHSNLMVEEMGANELLQTYGALTYTSDVASMEEAHRHDMSFGKYRAYLELSQYDESITVEECHGMTIREIHNRIESCLSHESTGVEGSNYDVDGIMSDHHEASGTEGSDGTGVEGSDGEGAGIEGSNGEGAEIEGSDHDSTEIEGSDHDSTGIEGSDHDGTGIEGSDHDGTGIGGSHHGESGETHGEHHG